VAPPGQSRAPRGSGFTAMVGYIGGLSRVAVEALTLSRVHLTRPSVARLTRGLYSRCCRWPDSIRQIFLATGVCQSASSQSACRGPGRVRAQCNMIDQRFCSPLPQAQNQLIRVAFCTIQHRPSENRPPSTVRLHSSFSPASAAILCCVTLSPVSQGEVLMKFQSCSRGRVDKTSSSPAGAPRRVISLRWKPACHERLLCTSGP